MQRRQFLINSGLTTAGLMLAQKQILASLFQVAPYKITMLSKTAGIFTEKGGTIAFVLARKGIIVVDAQFPEQSTHLIEELKKQSSHPFQMLINTHHHGDHTAGNISFKGLVKNVLAHENSLKNQQTVAVNQKTEDKQLYPDMTYTNTWCESVAKEKICLYYYGAGHTNGDSLVHLVDQNIVHMGDLVFNRRHPFVDRSAGADIKNWITVLEKASKQFDSKTQFVFGHAADGFNVTGTTEDLKAFGGYLGNVLSFVGKEINAGKTKDEILKATSIPGSPEWTGDGIQRPLTAAYEELVSRG
jgi:cyclase